MARWCVRYISYLSSTISQQALTEGKIWKEEENVSLPL